MRGRGHLLLALLLLSGCLAAPEAQPAPAADPDPVVGSDGAFTIAYAPDPAVPNAGEESDGPLLVSWSPEAPVAGDLFTVRIDAPMRWPEPRCVFQQLPGRELLVGGGGGEGASLPAYERDGAYYCEREVLPEASAIVLSVTRSGPNITRVHGPHVIPVEAERFAERVAFDEFELDADDAGLPVARATVPTKLSNLAWPDAPPPIYGSDSTYAWVSIEVIPADVALHMSDYAEPEWTSLQGFAAHIDAPARVQRALRDMGEDAQTRSYFLLAVAHASNDIAFAVSDGQVRGFGECADGSCFVRDG